MTVDVVDLEELKLVAIKVVGRRSELSHRIPLAWLELTRQLDDIPHRTDPHVFYGAFQEIGHQSDAADAVHAYWVGAPVSAFGALPPGLSALSIPARRYATTTVRGSAEQIDSSYRALAGWLQEQDRLADPAAFGFERYDRNRQEVTPPYERFDYDVYRPLR